MILPSSKVFDQPWPSGQGDKRSGRGLNPAASSPPPAPEVPTGHTKEPATVALLSAGDSPRPKGRGFPLLDELFWAHWT